ncbi:hypothetical protein NDN08_001014 [Rhodosorus marinus]|uniref:AMP-dependent synthetase/ligase domain-containing protein n=1 Tax=Rhodosorus marinus TaxID=101924 RepID=A0AAV8UVB5_9RHOD|nr:hypothetical protein NDN08_001014 [Rhodosorus marinus]
MAARAFSRSSFSRSRSIKSYGSEAIDKLTILRDLPKSRYATRPAIVVIPPPGSTAKPRQFSHIDIFKMVENVAHSLRENGVRPKTKVVTVLPPNLDGIVAFFALQWVNAVTIALQPDMSVETMLERVKSSGAEIVITSDVIEDEREANEVYQKVVRLNSELNALAWHVSYNNISGVELKTGGKSFGVPAWRGGYKDFTVEPTELSVYTFSPGAGTDTTLAIGLTHENITAAAKAFVAAYELFDGEEMVMESNSRTVLTSDFSSVQGILTLVSSFYAGGSLIMYENGEFRPTEFWDLALAHELTWVSVNQTQFKVLYHKRKEGVVPSKLKYIRICDDDFQDTAEQLSYEKVLGCHILESYGPPEASGIVTTEVFSEEVRGTLGAAVLGCEVAVFAADKSRLEQDEEGDVAVRGLSVTSGFLNDEEETASSIITIKTALGDSTWFLTGDRGKVDESGRLILTGSVRGARAQARLRRDVEASFEDLPPEVEETKDLTGAPVAVANAVAAGAGATAVLAKPADDANNEGRQIRRLTEDDIKKVGPDWCIVTPFLGIPAEDDDVEEKVVLMRRVSSDEVVEISDLPDSVPLSSGQNDSSQSANIAAAEAAATAAAATAAANAAARSQADGQVTKKIVKFGGVTYEYFYTHEDEEEMLMELLGDDHEGSEKKRSVKLPPKYQGGYFTEEADENDRIQVRIMTTGEATQFRRKLEHEFAAKLEEEKGRMRTEYDALLAAALVEQDSQFQQVFTEQSKSVQEEYNRKFDEESQQQLVEVQKRLIEESKARKEIYEQLLSENGEKEFSQAENTLQSKREKDRTEVLDQLTAMKGELTFGVSSYFKGVDNMDDVEASKGGVSRFDRTGDAKKPALLMLINDPEKVRDSRPELDAEFLKRMQEAKEEESRLWRASVVADLNKSAFSVIRDIEDRHAMDQMSYAKMLEKIEGLKKTQSEMEENLSLAKQVEVDRARELGEALAEERKNMGALSGRLEVEAMASRTEPAIATTKTDTLETAISDTTTSAHQTSKAASETVASVQTMTVASDKAIVQARTASTAATTGSDATVRAADVVKLAANRQPEMKETVLREVLPGDVVGERFKKRTISVDLRSIDEALKAHPSVADARAFTTPNRKSTFDISAVVQLKEGARASEAWLKQHALNTLPVASVPTRFFYTTTSIPPGRKQLAWNPDLQLFTNIAGESQAYIPPKRVERAEIHPAETPQATA